MKTLPNECLFEIFIKLNSINLFSCLLVNRNWCRNVVPLLWRRPITLKNRKLIRTCLLLLNAEEQALLMPFEIILPKNPKPLFAYTSYIKNISIWSSDGIVNWLNHEGHGPRRLAFSENDNVVQAIKSSLISMFLRTAEKLQRLRINNSRIQNLLTNILFKNITLSYLSIWNCLLSSEHLSEALGRSKTLISLYIGSSQLGFEGEKALAEALCKNTTLTYFGLYNNQLGTEKGKIVIKALSKNTSLTSLRLISQISIEGGKALAKVLSKNTTLTILNIGNNQLGFEGVNELADALCKNTTLTSLDLNRNNIDIEGVRLLAKAFCKNTTLVSLNLSANRINSDGGKILAEALYVNTIITSLILVNNNIDENVLDRINNLLERNQNIVKSSI